MYEKEKKKLPRKMKKSRANRIIEERQFKYLLGLPEEYAPKIGNRKQFMEVHYEIINELKKYSSGQIRLKLHKYHAYRLKRPFDMSYKLLFSSSALKYIITSVSEEFLGMGDIETKLNRFINQVIRFGSPIIRGQRILVTIRNIRKAEMSPNYHCPKPWC